MSGQYQSRTLVSGRDGNVLAQMTRKSLALAVSAAVAASLYCAVGALSSAQAVQNVPENNAGGAGATANEQMQRQQDWYQGARPHYGPPPQQQPQQARHYYQQPRPQYGQAQQPQQRPQPQPQQQLQQQQYQQAQSAPQYQQPQPRQVQMTAPAQVQAQPQQDAQQQAQLRAQQQAALQQAQMRAQQQAAQQQAAQAQMRAQGQQAVPQQAAAPQGRIRNVSMQIPRPNPNIDYSGDARTVLQGNGLIRLKAIGANHLNTASEEEEDENPLASPYYDPITGKVNKPAYVIEEEERARQTKTMPSLNEMEERLRAYDVERTAKLKAEGKYQPFGTFKNHDAVYSYLPDNKDVFYCDREEDKAALQDMLTPVEKDSGGEMGFVVLDRNGIVALKDNSDFPLVGISKFHLAYAVASLMSDRGDTETVKVPFFVNQLRRDIKSPLADNLLNKVDRNILDATGNMISDPNSNENRLGSRERGKIIASIVQQQQAGNAQKPDMDEVRLHSMPKKDIDAYEQQFKNLQDSRSRLDMSISDLMYYSLGISDSNASGFLLNYIGSLTSLEIFDRVKGLHRSKYRKLEADIAANPDYGYENTAPLYESAKMLGLFFQDPKIRNDVRDFIGDIMLFNVTGKDGIQKGVKKTIRAHGVDVKTIESNMDSLKIYSREGVGGISPTKGVRTVVTDLAYIDYSGQCYVMAISVRDITGAPNRTKRQAEMAIARAAELLFKYILDRPAYQGSLEVQGTGFGNYRN